MARAARPRPFTAVRAVLAAGLAASVLSSCGAAQDAVSSATARAQQQAEQKAQELAVQALRSQVCRMTADGTLSRAEVARLGQELDAAQAAGVPAQLVATVRPLLAEGGSATKAQVRRVHAATCTG
jgi:hypothetical protein